MKTNSTKTQTTPAPSYDRDVANRFTLFRTKYIAESQAQAARDTKFSQASISMMEAGKQSIGYKVINLLIKKYNLNAEWLATGKGEPINKQIQPEGGLLGKSIKSLEADNRELHTRIIQMEKAILILEKNQAHFIKLIERFVKDQHGD